MTSIPPCRALRTVSAARFALLLMATVALAACGGGDDAGAGAVVPPGATGPTLSERTIAAKTTAESSANACAPIRPFYWEVGDATAALASGSVASSANATRYAADTTMDIASASKWVYGTYVVQKRAGTLTTDDVRFLGLRSGYIDFLTCEAGETVQECAEARDNDRYVAAADGRFFYGGSHMQQHALREGLGPLAGSTLAAEMRRVIGTDIALAYLRPWLAGGATTTPADYARLLRGILGGRLLMRGALGTQAVCTHPSACATALFSPIQEETASYSIGHWVETDPMVGDGAFSSAGAFGFYPWIDATKTWYGVVAREDSNSGGGYDSLLCGRQIRKAWTTAIAR